MNCAISAEKSSSAGIREIRSASDAVWHILSDKLLFYRIHSGQVSKMHREEQIRCDKATQKKLLMQLLDSVTEEELDLHCRYSTGHYHDLMLTKDVRRWYRKLIRANDKKKIYSRWMFRVYIYRIIRSVKRDSKVKK